MAGSRLTQVAAIIVGVCAGTTLTLYSLPIQASACGVGPTILAVNPTLTPLLLENSPFNGSGSGSVWLENHTVQLTLPISNGSVEGYFEHIGWMVNASESVTGSRTDCTGIFSVSHTDDWTSTTFQLNNGSVLNFTNDSQVPGSVALSWTAAAIYIHDVFSRSTGRVSTCGTNASVQHVESTHYTVGLDLTFLGSEHWLNETIAVNASYTYTFPANTGTWLIDNLSAPGGPGFGWAFSYSPCV